MTTHAAAAAAAETATRTANVVRLSIGGPAPLGGANVCFGRGAGRAGAGGPRGATVLYD